MENNTEVKATNEVADSMADVVAQMDNGQSKLKKGQLVKAIISSASDEGVAVLLPFFKKEILLEKDEIDCEEYKPEDYAAKIGDEIEVMVVSPANPVKLPRRSSNRSRKRKARSKRSATAKSSTSSARASTRAASPLPWVPIPYSCLQKRSAWATSRSLTSTSAKSCA